MYSAALIISGCTEVYVQYYYVVDTYHVLSIGYFNYVARGTVVVEGSGFKRILNFWFMLPI